MIWTPKFLSISKYRIPDKYLGQKPQRFAKPLSVSSQRIFLEYYRKPLINNKKCRFGNRLIGYKPIQLE